MSGTDEPEELTKNPILSGGIQTVTPTRLRAWTRKYGNAGWLMVAAYFAGCWLWTKRLYTLPAGLLALLLSIALLHPHANPPVPPPTPPIPIAVPAPTPPVSQPTTATESTKDKLKVALMFREEHNRWRLEGWSPNRYTNSDDYVKFYRNGRLILTLHAGEMHSTGLGFGTASWILRYPIIVLEGYTGCGHGVTRRLYAIRHGKLIQMVEFQGENGGPIFHDYDGDGEREWVFDDYDSYLYNEERPKYLLVYKELKNGQLKLWKRLPNPHRRHLPDNL